MCTSLIIKDADGVAHVGRTMELTSEEAWHMYYLPAGHAATSLAPAGGPGLSYGSDHPVLGIGTPLHDGLNNWFVQGFNDKGVVGCVQAFGDTTSLRFRRARAQRWPPRICLPGGWGPVPASRS